MVLGEPKQRHVCCFFRTLSAALTVYILLYRTRGRGPTAQLLLLRTNNLVTNICIAMPMPSCRSLRLEMVRVHVRTAIAAPKSRRNAATYYESVTVDTLRSIIQPTCRLVFTTSTSTSGKQHTIPTAESPHGISEHRRVRV